MAAGPDWAPLLASVFAKSDASTLKVSKAVRKAVSKAAKRSDQPEEQLRDSLDAYLRGAQGSFRLEGGNVTKAPETQQAEGMPGKKKKKKKQLAAADSPAATAQPEPKPAAGALIQGKKQGKERHAAEGSPAGSVQQVEKKKKKKKGKKQLAAAESPATSVQPEPEPAPAASPPTKKKGKKQGKERHAAEGSAEGSGQQQEKKKGKKRRAAEAAAAEERGQQHAQPPAAAEQQEEQEGPPAKRRKKAKKAAGDPAAKQGGVGAVVAAAAAAAAAGADDDAGGNGSPLLELEEEEAQRWRASAKRQNVKSGAFSKAEKETLRQAVLAYAAKHGHSTDSFDWLYGSSRSGATKGTWSKIATALPQRDVKSVWAAGTRMFHEGNYQGKWSPDEDAQLLQLVSERGRKWKEIGGAVGRMPESCRDRWLMIRQGSARKEGRWAPDETERLRAAVQEYLEAKTAEEARMFSGGGDGEEDGMVTLSLADIEGAAGEPLVDEDGAATVTVSRRIVLDDIDWNVVSQAVGTRSNVQCLEKWYTQLSPSMVARGEWGSGDDRRLLRALFQSGAAHDYELDWGQLVRGRTAQQARRRWRLMVKAVPDHRDLEFEDLVDGLVDKFMPQLKEAAQQAQQAAAEQG